MRRHPSWNVQRGYGSFITFEFGRPHLKNWGIRKHKRKGKNVLPASCRLVYVHGDWHLWIYCCAWFVSQDGKAIAHSESSNDDIDRACAFLRGQKIRGIAVLRGTGKTVFSFDLGGAMVTCPSSAETTDQWMLSCPNNKVLSFRSDGYFAYTSRRRKRTKAPGKQEYTPVNSKLISVGQPPLQPLPRFKAFSKLTIRRIL